MFSRIGFGAAAVLTAGVLAIGCSDDSGGDTIIGGTSFATDNFPGSTVAANNVADDGKAFTNQNQSKNDAFTSVNWNYANGTAIAMYQLQDASNGNFLLYGSYFDGTRWHAPVQIRGRRGGAVEDPSSQVEQVRVLWLNTSAANASHNGDALIFFTRRDAEPVFPVGATVHEDGNIRLWGTYFDPSAATSTASGSVIRGFDTEALVLDTDNTLNAPTGDPDVGTVGLVSDSLHGSHQFFGFGPGTDPSDYAPTTSGDATTFASVVFTKEAGSGATLVGTRWFSVEADLAAVDNDLANIFPSAASQLSSSAGALATGESVNGFSCTVHDRLMFWSHTDVDGDTQVTVSEFDEAGVADTDALGDAVDGTNSTSDTVQVPEAAAVFGPDHGLAAWYIFFDQSGFATDAIQDDGEAAEDGDLMVAQINADEALAVQRLKIDSFDDVIESGTNPFRSERDISDWNVRINRTAEYIGVLYSQANTDEDTNTTPALIENNIILYATAVQTRVRVANGVTPARDLDEAVFDNDAALTNVQGIPVPMQEASGVVLSTNDRADLGQFAWQLELVSGEHYNQLFGDDGADPKCGVQSNAYRMNFIYTQFDNPNTTAGDIDRLLVNGIVVTPGATTATVVDPIDVELVSTNEEVVDTQDADWDYNGNGFNLDGEAFAVDAGDSTRDATGAPTAESGRVLVFYQLESANTPDGEDFSTGSFAERRAYVWDEVDGTVLLSTGLNDEGVNQLNEFGEFVAVITAGAESTATHYAGTTLHVYWTEERDTAGSAENTGDVIPVGGENAGFGPARLMTRSYSKTAINDGSTANDTLEDRFTPNLEGGTAEGEPVAIDNPTDGDLFSVALSKNADDVEVAKTGNTVGLYFAEDQHIYYQETTSDALNYTKESGVHAPQLVDNDSETGIRVLGYDVFFPPRCEQLSKSMVLFARDDASQGPAFGNTAIRLYVRIHN